MRKKLFNTSYSRINLQVSLKRITKNVVKLPE
jgi:hypothetical protein